MDKTIIFLYYLSNILYCSSYVLRDILWLRLLTIIGSIFAFPYFFFRETPLYSAVFWQVAYFTINVINITILILERRPVALTMEQKRLHLVVFHSLTPREMVKFFSIAEYKDIEPNKMFIKQGTSIDELFLISRGTTKIERNGEIIAYVKDEGFIGEMSYITGKPTSADVISMGPVRCIVWQKSKLDEFFKKEPTIKNLMQAILAHDLSEKLSIMLPKNWTT